MALLQGLVDVGPAVGHHPPARTDRRASNGPQALGPQGRLAHAALAGTGTAVGVGLLGFGHGLAHVELLVEQAQQRQGGPSAASGQLNSVVSSTSR